MKATICFISIWLVLSIGQIVRATDVVVLSPAKEIYPIGLQTKILKDETKSLTINEIRQLYCEKKFVKSKYQTPNFGYVNADYWVKFNVQAVSRGQRRWILEIENPLLDEIELYIQQADSTFMVKKAGDFYPFSSRVIQNRNFLFRLPLTDNKPHVVYIHFSGEASKRYPMTIYEEMAFYKHDGKQNMIWGFYFGIMFLIILYNAFLFIKTFDYTFLLYVLYSFSFALLQGVLLGYAYEYLWPEYVWFNNISHIVMLGLVTSFGVAFSFAFLRIWKNLRNLRYGVLLMGVLNFYAAIWAFIDYNLLLNQTASNIAVLTITLLLIVSFIEARNGYRPAYYYLLAFACLLFASLAFILMNEGFLPDSPVIRYGFRMSSALEAALLSLALGDRLNEARLQKYFMLKTQEKIARDLHDDIGATLSSISLMSDMAKRRANKVDKELIKTLEDISKSAREMIGVMRDMVWTVKPREEDFEDDIFERVQSFGLGIMRAKNINFNFQTEENLQDIELSLMTRRNLYLIFKETLNNIAKHSGATSAEINVKRQQNRLIVQIADNGKGFDLLKGYHGNGLKNIQQRALEENIQLAIDSEIGRGTAVNIEVVF